MPDRSSIVAADDVTIAYGETVALKNFSLSIAPGEIVGLIGEAACGKTTAALALLGLIRPPGKVVSGRVDFGGRDLLHLPKADLQALRGKDVGLIVQNPRSALNPMLPIGRQIETVYRTHNAVTKAAARAHAIQMLASVGINDPERRVHAYPHEISGGMAQRVLIAIALSSKPKLLIADEPTSGLDVTIQAQFLDQMWHTVRNAGSAMLLVTQDIGIIANYCDRILVMQDGQVVEQGGVRGFFARPAHPYSRAILAMQAERASMGREVRQAKRDAVPLIEVRDMVKRFALRGTRKKLQAVGGVSLTIAAGETLGLVGESGSGKTTVGRCILGLIRPDAGVLLHRGRPVGAVMPRALRPKLQIVFQDPYDTLDPRWTVTDLLGEPLKLHFSMRQEARDKRIAGLLDLVGLDRAVGAARPRMLSAGQQQRVGIARALACEPELIVLDEPTSALAPAARTAIVALLRDLQARLGLAYLFISHDLATVRHVSHRIAVMYLSQIVEIGDRDAIFNHPRHPYTRALLAAHLDADPERRRPEHPPASRLEGEIPSPVDLPPGCFLAGRCPDEQAVCRTQKQVLADESGGRLVRCWRATQEQPLELLHQ